MEAKKKQDYDFPGRIYVQEKRKPKPVQKKVIVIPIKKEVVYKPAKRTRTKENALGYIPPTEQEKEIISAIVKLVSDTIQIPVENIVSKKRNRDFAYARARVYHILRHHTEITYKAIAHEFGGCDHSSVMAGEKNINNRLDTDWKNKQEAADYYKLLEDSRNVIISIINSNNIAQL